MSKRIIVLFIIVMIIELFLFKGGLIFTFIISTFLMYWGRKLYHRVFGKILLWLGICGGVSSVFGLFTFRLLLLALVISFFGNRRKKRRISKELQWNIVDAKETTCHPSPKNFNLNYWIGAYSTPKEPYDWQDIQAFSGVGETVIDLTNTVLPKEEAIVNLRHGIGNIRIIVPYELELSLRHSVIAGDVKIFDKEKKQIVNEKISFQTANYYKATKRAKIVTSIAFGRLEVIRR